MTDPVSLSPEGQPVIFGEVLFDIFPDGQAVLGGASFNVAWHLQGFGLRPLFISRIGMDSNGEKVLQYMQEWGMETASVQRDPLHPTGMVKIDLDEGQPSFSILPDQAYDHIDSNQSLQALAGGECSLLYHGSLIARSPASRSSLGLLHKQGSLPVFLDINLRSPWWDMLLVNEQLATARWVKMNDDELIRIASGEDGGSGTLEEMAWRLCARCHLEILVITRGAEGAFMITGDQQPVSLPAVKIHNLIDTVGAGDAFSAIMMVALIREWPMDLALRRAGEFAAEICRTRGAIWPNEDIYQKFQTQWMQP